MEKINIAELLKDCPKGMELDCTVYDNCTLEIVFEGCLYPIQIQTPEGLVTLTKYGSMSQSTHSKCVIFPKGKTTWEGFVPPCKFKDGDILAYTSLHTSVFIYRYKDNEPNYTTSFYVGYTIGVCYSDFHIYNQSALIALNGNCDVRLATEEEKQKLFDAIKANGYKWNEETKTLEKLIEPKFKVGDRIKRNEKTATIVRIYKNWYDIRYDSGIGSFTIDLQDEWELVPNKFDMTTLVPFESRVLVREDKTDVWRPTFYGFFHQHSKRFYTTSSGTWLMCIPYNEDTKHLTGTTNDCDDFYKTWEK